MNLATLALLLLMLLLKLRLDERKKERSKVEVERSKKKKLNKKTSLSADRPRDPPSADFHATDRVVLLTGISGTPCNTPWGDYLLEVQLRNKADWARLHGELSFLLFSLALSFFTSIFLFLFAYRRRRKALSRESKHRATVPASRDEKRSHSIVFFLARKPSVDYFSSLALSLFNLSLLAPFLTLFFFSTLSLFQNTNKNRLRAPPDGRDERPEDPPRSLAEARPSPRSAKGNPALEGRVAALDGHGRDHQRPGDQVPA